MTALEDFLNVWSAALGRACWQGGLVVLAVGCVCRLLPAMPARIQSWLWRLATLKFLIVLLWPLPVPLPLLPVSSAASAAVEQRVSFGAGLAADATYQAESAACLPSVGTSSGLRLALFAAWLAGLGVAWSKLYRAWRSAAAVHRQSRPLEGSPASRQVQSLAEAFGLRVAPALRAIDGEGSPLVVGVFRSAIVVPAVTWERLTDAEQSLALEHEVAHVKARDLLWSAVAALVRTAFFFHPLAWLCERQLRLSQELAADEQVVGRRGHDPVQYARFLLTIAGKLGPARPFPTLALGTTGPRNSLRKRILAMQWMGQTTRRTMMASTALLAFSAIPGLIPWKLVAAEGGGTESPARPVVLGATPAQDAVAASQVQIEARFLDLPAGMSRKALEAVVPDSEAVALLSPEQTAVFLKKLRAAKSVQVVASPKLITLPGHSAKVQVGHSATGEAAATDADFEGLSLDVVPESKGRDLMLKIDARRRTRVPGSEPPAFQETHIETQLVMPPDQTALVAGAGGKDREFVMLISAKLLRTVGE